VRKEWNNEEIEHLKEFIGQHKVTTIAQYLDRSYESVRVKMTRLGLSNTKMQTGYITIGELSRHLKVERNTVKCWAKNHNLPFVKKTTRKSRSYYFIHPKSFWKWAETHRELVQFSSIEHQVLLPEPGWVNKERKKEMEDKIIKKKAYKPWTTKEDQKLLQLRGQGFTHKEIGHRLNRSATSIARRYSRIIILN
jgi:hypothetical protein